MGEKLFHKSKKFKAVRNRKSVNYKINFALDILGLFKLIRHKKKHFLTLNVKVMGKGRNIGWFNLEMKITKDNKVILRKGKNKLLFCQPPPLKV